METIKAHDKPSAGAHPSDAAVRGPAPGRSPGRPQQRFALLLLGLILISVGAPPTADMAYGEKAGSNAASQTVAHLGCNQPNTPVEPTPSVVWEPRE
jgi:hypothetical protein